MKGHGFTAMFAIRLYHQQIEIEFADFGTANEFRKEIIKTGEKNAPKTKIKKFMTFMYNVYEDHVIVLLTIDSLERLFFLHFRPRDL